MSPYFTSEQIPPSGFACGAVLWLSNAVYWQYLFTLQVSRYRLLALPAERCFDCQVRYIVWASARVCVLAAALRIRADVAVTRVETLNPCGRVAASSQHMWLSAGWIPHWFPAPTPARIAGRTDDNGYSPIVIPSDTYSFPDLSLSDKYNCFYFLWRCNFNKIVLNCKIYLSFFLSFW